MATVVRGTDTQPATKSSEKPQRTVLAALTGGKYLHAEVTASEILAFSAVGRVGFQHVHLLLGAALVRGEHQGGSFGIGLGTQGRAYGRFTPSLDAMGWLLGSNREGGDDQGVLMQLRPALAWQLKPGKRWQIIAGPTLNLATTHREGMPTNWSLGQDLWLWLNSSDEHGRVRLWPGVQVGVRF